MINASHLQTSTTANNTLGKRLLQLAFVFVIEKLFLNLFVNFSNARESEGLGQILRLTHHWGSRVLVAFAASLAVFAMVREGGRSGPVVTYDRDGSFRPQWLLAHIALIVALVPVSYLLYRDGPALLPFAVVGTLSLLLAVAAVWTAFIAMAPLNTWLQAARRLGILWLYAFMAALLGVGAWQWSQSLWQPTAAFTFDLVRLVLSPMFPSLRADPMTLVIGTNRFAVRITELCSGLEGVGFMLAFSSAWLLCFRREYIFPRALLLLPAGLLLIFVLNVLRIAALFLIGNAGFWDIAEYGFHSQSGWIAFIAAACTLAYASRRSTWLSRVAALTARDRRSDNPTASYLLPLLAILCAGTLARAASNGFETLYPLRMLAGGAALWFCRSRWRTLDWHFTWRGPLIGASMFVIWILAARLALPTAAMPETLGALSPVARAVWIVSRALSAALLVPLAEELAYRAYLLRRLTSSDFESVPFQDIRWPAMLGAAVVFGLAHGSLWLPGMITGLAYGAVLVRSGRMGEAVAAHAVTNTLIAFAVLYANQWQLW